jgi:hypothetical protein
MFYDLVASTALASLTSSKQLVFGTFNRRIGPKASSSGAIRTTYNWLFENIQADRGPRPS